MKVRKFVRSHTNWSRTSFEDNCMVMCDDPYGKINYLVIDLMTRLPTPSFTRQDSRILTFLVVTRGFQPFSS